LPHDRGFQQGGTASWYGKKFHGRTTASGEIYNMHAMTAAHKTLPLGTLVVVHNLRNNRQIKVRINDRGPFVRGRIIDLSHAAAEKIGMIGAGTAPVKIVALAGPMVQTDRPEMAAAYEQGNFTVQVGAFRQPENAQRLKRKLDSLYGDACITPYHNGSETFYRVHVGRKPELSRAEELEKRLIENGYPGAFVIAE
jgi:rare lipoprotein A